LDYTFEADCNRQKQIWKARHRWLKPEELWLSVGTMIDERGVSRVVNALISESDSEVILTIESRGGSGWFGYQLYRALRSHAAPVTTVCNRQCSSAAILPYLAGDHRLASSQAIFLLHHGESTEPLQGRRSAANLQAEADLLKHWDEEFVQLTVHRCRWWPIAEVRAAHTDEALFSAEDARLRGIVHRVTD